VREAGVPGGGGIMTASSLALFYQAVLTNPDGLWDAAVLADAKTNVRCSFEDPLMHVAANRSLAPSGSVDIAGVSFAGGLALGRLIDRYNPYVVLGAAYAAAAACIVAIASSGGSPLLLLFALLAGVGVSGAQIGLNAVTAASYPTAIRATGIGWALGMGRVGSILGPAAGGALLAAGWTTQSLLMAAVVPAMIASAAVFALRRV